MDSEIRKRQDPEHGEAVQQPEPAAASGQGEVEQLRAELEEAQRERAQFKSTLQRAQADLANYRRRVEEEREEAQKAASFGLVLKLLPVLDDLERALGQVQQEAHSTQGWSEGAQLIMRKFQRALEEVGVRKIEALGREIDPWEHEVVSYEETTNHSEGHVLQVVREGYKLHGRVLRPSLVTVAKTPAAKVDEGPKENDENQRTG